MTDCTTHLDRIKARIAHLLRVSKDDAATQGEIENAIRAARNLMLAHHVEEADLEVADGESVPDMGRANSWTKFTNIATWEKDLAFFVESLIGGIVYTYGRGQRMVDGRLKFVGQIGFWGIAEEAKLAADAYEEFALTVFTMARAKYGGAYRGDGGVYAEGFVAGLTKQLQKIDKSDHESTNAIVCRSMAIEANKKKRADNWMRQQLGPLLGSASVSQGASGSRTAWMEGENDGKNCEIGRIAERRSKLPFAPKQLGWR